MEEYPVVNVLRRRRKIMPENDYTLVTLKDGTKVFRIVGNGIVKDEKALWDGVDIFNSHENPVECLVLDIFEATNPHHKLVADILIQYNPLKDGYISCSEYRVYIEHLKPIGEANA
jgi:hypothetical protein